MFLLLGLLNQNLTDRSVLKRHDRREGVNLKLGEIYFSLFFLFKKG
jgi:hypothetical protein